MKSKTTTGTIISGLLVCAMLVPTRATSFAANIDTSDIDIKQSTYFKKMLRQETVQDMTEQQRSEFVQNVRDYFSSTQYHKQIFVMFEELMEIDSQITKAEREEKDTTRLTQEAWSIIYDLEDYGIVSYERLVSNPSYWADRAYDAVNQINQNKAVKTSKSGTGHDDVRQVHMDGVDLANQSDVRVPCVSASMFTGYCPNPATAHGLDTKTKTASIASWYGNFFMYSKVCITDADHHDNITTTYDHHHKISNAFGTVQMLEEDTLTKTTTGGQCDIATSVYDGIQAVPSTMAHSHTYVHQAVSF